MCFKYIKSLFEKKNEGENYNLITKELYEKNNNIVTEQLWDRKLIYILKHYLIFLFPNYPKMILILQTNHIL